MLKQEEKISQSISEIQQFEQDMKGIVDYCESEWLSIEDDKDRKSVYDMASKYTKEALETFAAHVDILSTNLTHYLMMQDNELKNIEVSVTRCKTLCQTSRLDSNQLDFRERVKRSPVSKTIQQSIQLIDQEIKFKHAPLNFDALNNISLSLQTNIETVDMSEDGLPIYTGWRGGEDREQKQSYHHQLHSLNQTDNNNDIGIPAVRPTSSRIPPQRKRRSSRLHGIVTNSSVSTKTALPVTPSEKANAAPLQHPPPKSSPHGSRPVGSAFPPPMKSSSEPLNSTEPTMKIEGGDVGRGGLLESIRAGKKLKSAKTSKPKKTQKPLPGKTMSLMEEMAMKRVGKAAKANVQLTVQKSEAKKTVSELPIKKLTMREEMVLKQKKREAKALAKKDLSNAKTEINLKGNEIPPPVVPRISKTLPEASQPADQGPTSPPPPPPRMRAVPSSLSEKSFINAAPISPRRIAAPPIPVSPQNGNGTLIAAPAPPAPPARRKHGSHASTTASSSTEYMQLYNVSSQALTKYQQYFRSLVTENDGVIGREKAMGMFYQSVSYYCLLFVDFS
jgi:hypothetical protein